MYESRRDLIRLYIIALKIWCANQILSSIFRLLLSRFLINLYLCSDAFIELTATFGREVNVELVWSGAKYREVEEQRQISWFGSVANRSNSDVSLCGSDASHVDR